MKLQINKTRYILVMISTAILSIILINSLFNKKVDRKMLERNLEIINKECNFIYENMENAEEKYTSLLEIETDYFKRGLYSSALVQYYSISNDYDNAIKYSKEAVDNYSKIPGGEYYSIAEKKYTAWIMLILGKYPDSFRETSELLELLNTSSNVILTEEEIADSEALIYSIFLCIYTDFEILDKAEIYYNKLCNIKMTEKLEISKGDKVAASKMLYASKINNTNLMKKYADECYEINLKRDIKNGTYSANSVISNVALANIKLGNFELALEQLKIAEEFYDNVGGRIGLVNIYSNYAQYYRGVGNDELAMQYYNKTMMLYNEYEDYFAVKEIISEVIDFLSETNINADIDKYYSAYYELSEKNGGDKAINKLLSQIVDINDGLNNSTVLLLENKARNNEIAVAITIGVIIILAILITIMYYLIGIKNKSEKTLREIAKTDYLTRLNTRSYGEELILEEIRKNNTFSMAIIDIDNFKNINDNYGHIFGDLILKEVAKKLRDGINNEDIIARFGGEEFIIAFVNKDKEESKKILDEIRKNIQNVTFEHNVQVSFSAGIEMWDNTSLDNVIKRADKLLYKAKSEGRNRVVN